jgi:hypothetical protein
MTIEQITRRYDFLLGQISLSIPEDEEIRRLGSILRAAGVKGIGR